MLEWERWENAPDDLLRRKKSLSRQRVAARNRPEDITTCTVKTKIITRRERVGMGGRLGRALHRWLPWFPAAAGGRA
jgi:hypothetical protein